MKHLITILLALFVSSSIAYGDITNVKKGDLLFIFDECALTIADLKGGLNVLDAEQILVHCVKPSPEEKEVLTCEFYDSKGKLYDIAVLIYKVPTKEQGGNKVSVLTGLYTHVMRIPSTGVAVMSMQLAAPLPAVMTKVCKGSSITGQDYLKKSTKVF